MTNPYQPPQTLAKVKTRHLYFWGVVLLVIAVAMPILGLAGTVRGMMQSFGELSSDTAADAESVASTISFSLTTTVLGLVVGVICGISGAMMVFTARRRGSP